MSISNGSCNRQVWCLRNVFDKNTQQLFLLYEDGFSVCLDSFNLASWMAQMLKRSFSLSATAFSGIVKLPTQVHGIEVEKDLQKVRSTYQQDQKFKEFIRDPSLKRLKKKEAVLSVAQKLGLTKESVNFLGLLAENGRLGKLESVISSYEHIMRAHRGELFVQVTSSEPLSKSHESALNDALNKMAKSGQKLNVVYTVNRQSLVV
ncbi:hypothetical protein KIN20_025128 [Parelaphostrongylus tenuis]|uniref:Oligomycin sensitivity conferral protein n=1 Tax=Parelaphostrongylus tenuis TaxID=148309 RepID=A0AAD5QXQ5_PARTN|nr:hypothetical protein KIN20_025128 [Parelaphostrongylus tenuis]